MPKPTHSPASPSPLGEGDIAAIQQALDGIPPPLEPLDVSMLDGYLCGVLLQPRTVPEAQWWPHVLDIDGRPGPDTPELTALRGLVSRRHAELADSIARRQWFDPWVFELESAEAVDDDTDDDKDAEDPDGAPPEVDAVYPWVAGFAAAAELFPGLMQQEATALTEPLALLYRHLDPDDLEDADELLAEIDTLEPPQDLGTAVEELVRATLLLADITRPVMRAASPRSARKPSRGVRRPGPRSR